MLNGQRLRRFVWGLLCLPLALALSGCPQQQVISCTNSEEYNSKLGVCVPCPPGTKQDKKTRKCVVITCAADEEYNAKLGACVRCATGTKLDFTTKKCVAVESDQDSQVGDQDVSIADVVEQVGDVFPFDDFGPDVREIVEQGAIGSACNMDQDCDSGLTCFDWPQGYCVKTSCNAVADCPEGSHCLPLLENGQACFQACEGSQQCRSGYACKGIAELGGATQNVCHPVGTENLALGKRCDGAEQCAGSMGCVALGPVSMCTETGCSDVTPCPESAACVALTTVPVCLPICSEDKDCDSAFAEAVACQEGKSIFNKDVKVCASANYGLTVGQQCYFNTECSTGYCHLIFVGKCTDNGSLCGSDRDCAQGFCTADPGSQRGICSKGCGPGDGCPTGNLCVESENTPVCMPNCGEAGKECGPSDFGMSCTYGMVFYPQAPSGKLACARNKSGDVGTDCDSNADCLKGDCNNLQGGEGYCMGPCVSNSQCSFGSACVGNLCLRMCTSDLECPQGQFCLNDIGAPDKICNYSI